MRTGGCPAHWPLNREPYEFENSMPWLVAAGDVRHGSSKRCAALVVEDTIVVALVDR